MHCNGGRMRLFVFTVFIWVVVFVASVQAAVFDAPPAESNTEGVEVNSGKAAAPTKKFKDEELIVKFKPEASADHKNNLHKKHGSEVIKEFPSLRLHHVKVKKGMTVEEGIKLYQADPSVEYAEPNFLYQTQLVPNDPLFSTLWGMTKIAAPSAWNSSTGSSDVVVGIIDTGIDYSHPDLQANLWVNPAENAGNTLDDDGNGYVNDVYGINAMTGSGNPMDDNGHGTHVAGTIGAVGSNGIGVAGLNWSVKMIACKFLNSSGSGSLVDAIDCLTYFRSLKDRGVNIVATNNSWAGGGYSQSLYDAIKAQGDILFMAAAGNDSRNTDLSPAYPASYDLPNIISVAATDSSDQLANFSNYGSRTVDVGAPGVSIYSTMSSTNAQGITGAYGYLSGTSMATPHVAGLAALLKAQDPSRDWTQIKHLIFSGGDAVTSLYGKSVTGRRINALGSVGAPVCSNRPLFLVGSLPAKLAPNHSYTLSVLSINCASSTGPVTVTTSDGVHIALTDPEQDGTFSGSWVPISFPVTLTYTAPAGSQSVTYTLLRVATYLPEARLDAPYSQQLTTTAGSASRWAIIGGALPVGLTLDPATGVISGTPTVEGIYSFVAQVTDTSGATATGSLYFVVNGGGWLDQTFGRIYDGDSYLEDKGVAVATDAAANSYVLGQSFNGANWDIVLLKYDAAGSLTWSRTYQRGEDEIGRSLAYDGAGHLYIAGATGGLGNHLLLKYDLDGNLLWERSWDRGGNDGASGVAVDSAGFIYTVGTYDSAQGERILLSKYDPEGNVLWTKGTNSAQDGEVGASIAVDRAGNIFVGGRDYKSYQGGGLTWTTPRTLLIKFNGSGNLLWSKAIVSNGTSCVVYSLATDEAGAVYAVYKEQNTDSAKPLKKYNADGTLAWEYRAMAPEAVAVAGDHVVIVGVGPTWNLGAYVLAVDLLGNKVWYEKVDQFVAGSALAIAANADGFSLTGYRTSGTDNDIITARYKDAPAIYDLAATAVSFSYSKGLLNYSLSVRNNGAGNPSPNIGLYFSADRQLSADDVKIVYSTVGVIPGGTEKKSEYYGVPLETTVPCGTYNLIAVVNYDSATIKETDRTNNTIVGDVYTVTRDLTISAVTGAVSGGNISYSVTERNLGNSDASWSTTGVYLSTSPVASTSDYLLTSFSAYKLPITDNRYFPAGSEVVFTGSVPLPAGLAPGTYYITAIADIKNHIPENDKSNNSKVGNVVIGRDLSITGFSGSVNGGNASYNITVRNQGQGTVTPSVALYLSPDAAVSGDDYPVAVIPAGTIPEGGEVTLTGTLPVPSGIPVGVYYLAALADPGNAVAETDETNNSATAGQFLIGSNPATLNYTRSGMGSGRVGFAPGGSCWTGCSPLYGQGTAVTLTAIADPGSVFKGWDGACYGSEYCTVVMNGDRNLSARFEKTIPTSSLLAGANSSGALLDGVAWMWGANLQGQLGDGTTSDRKTPTQIPALQGSVATTSGMNSFYGLALKGDGTVLAWGANDYGQLGDGTITKRTSPMVVPGLTGVVALATGFATSMALHDDGTVSAWGSGPVGDGTSTQRRSPVKVAGLSEVRRIAAGASHYLAVRSDGTVWTWGFNDHKQLGDGTTTYRTTPIQVPGLSEIIAVAAGNAHSVALKSDGTVWTWGLNWYGEVGDGTFGNDVAAPYRVPGVSEVVAIAAGAYSTVALRADGTVLTWGDNGYGQLGDGSVTERDAPVQVAGLSGVVSIAAGRQHVLAMKGDGSVWGWGDNYTYNLGTTGSNFHTAPVQVAFDTAAPTTTASPAGGSYASAQTVTLSANETATIYYTTDGSLPTAASTVYSAPLTLSGSTTIRFFAMDSAGNKEAVRSETYTIGPPAVPVADFTVSAISGNAPLSVNFSDLSTGATSWQWQFGDSATSTAQNPVHLYGAPGSYTVSLTATGPGGTDTRTKSGYLNVSTPLPMAIQPQYDAAADGATIKVWAGALVENLVLNRNIVVRIGGGYDFPFNSIVGATTIHGTLRLRNGKASISNLIMK